MPETTVDPRRSLDMLEGELSSLYPEIAGLTQAQWEAPSSCAGWQVADLVAHVSRNGESILLAVQRALTGDTTPAFGAVMAPREAEIRATGPAGCVALQQREYGEMVQLIQGLSDEQIAKHSFPHPAGPRTIAWYCTQRLCEVAFHRWDLNRSLGQDRPLEEPLANYVLPFLLDPTVPVIAGRLDVPPATFRLSAGGRSWTVTAGGDRVTVQTQPGAGVVADVESPPGWLALAIYGRTRIDRPEFKVTGAADSAERFAAVFGQP